MSRSEVFNAAGSAVASQADQRTGLTHASSSGHPDSAQTLDASGLKLILMGGRPIMPVATPARQARLVAKRAFDIMFALSALIVLAPLMLGVAVLIRLTSPGPAILLQRRYGQHGSAFEVVKFRTMYQDMGDPSGVAQTTENDPRITPVGRLIRKTNVDELPQLINVLIGQMSIIGPRPHAVGMLAAGVKYEELVDYYPDRLAMRPGITGWAQANGLRGPAHDPDLARRRIEHDLAYIQNFSLALDLRTIWLTARSEFRRGSGI